jgi:hypothetical protein
LVWRGFAFDPGARVVSKYLMLRSGKWVWERRVGGPARASSGPESRPRGRIALERGGVSPEGGVQPSSEVESCLRGCVALERGGVSPEGASSPQARRGFSGTALSPSSEVGFRPRGVGADRSVGR